MKPLALLAVLAFLGCADVSSSPVTAPASAEAPVPDLARPSEEAVTVRVAEARARLDSTEAGRIVLAAFDAHGGLDRWYANGPIHFRYTYERTNGDPPIDTSQTVAPWGARARHTLVSDTTVSFRWTGEEAWVQPDSAVTPTNARFRSLTPYYFVAMPFVLADPGVNLETAGQMTAEGQAYDLIHVTFDAGTGDAPDDYYYLLLDPETRRVGGVRYVVTYPGFFPEGDATPERLMLYDGERTASGITLREGSRSFAWTGSSAGEPAAEGTVTDLAFVPTATNVLFAMPDGARIQDER